LAHWNDGPSYCEGCAASNSEAQAARRISDMAEGEGK
jgi:hypothetical protein